jgi:transcriptional regulator with XRE-family HTH domain
MARDLLPERLRLWRKRLGYSQDAVALALGISRTQVTRWETGTKRIPLERLFDIADLYGVPASALLQEPDEVDFEQALREAAAGAPREEILAAVATWVAARKKGTP